MTHDDVRALLLSFPGVEDGVSYGEPSFKVAGKFFTWMRPALDDSIVVHLDNLDERELLIEMDPATFTSPTTIAIIPSSWRASPASIPSG